MAPTAAPSLSIGSKEELVTQAQALPVDEDHAVGFPLGGSTFRALMVDRRGSIVDTVEIPDPAQHYQDLAHAQAAALVRFGCRPRMGAASIAGPVPRRGLLKFTNLAWPAFDRDEAKRLFGLHLEWFNDGPAGYFGIPALDENDFDVLRLGTYQPGDPYGYAIVGTGFNFGTEKGREDGHGPFAPRSDEEWAYQVFLNKQLGYLPDWEDAASGVTGFRYAAHFIMQQMDHALANDPFVRAFFTTSTKDQGKVVTEYAKQDHPIAAKAAQLAFGIIGTWLGSLAVTSQVTRIDISDGILGKDEELRAFVMLETDFLQAFRRQGRPQFSDFADACTLRVCLRNPEHEGAVARATELLRATA